MAPVGRIDACCFWQSCNPTAQGLRLLSAERGLNSQGYHGLSIDLGSGNHIRNYHVLYDKPRP